MTLLVKGQRSWIGRILFISNSFSTRNNFPCSWSPWWALFQVSDPADGWKDDMLSPTVLIPRRWFISGKSQMAFGFSHRKNQMASSRGLIRDLQAGAFLNRRQDGFCSRNQTLNFLPVREDQSRNQRVLRREHFEQLPEGSPLAAVRSSYWLSISLVLWIVHSVSLPPCWGCFASWQYLDRIWWSFAPAPDPRVLQEVVFRRCCFLFHAFGPSDVGPCFALTENACYKHWSHHKHITDKVDKW